MKYLIILMLLSLTGCSRVINPDDPAITQSIIDNVTNSFEFKRKVSQETQNYLVTKNKEFKEFKESCVEIGRCLKIKTHAVIVEWEYGYSFECRNESKNRVRCD